MKEKLKLLIVFVGVLLVLDVVFFITLLDRGEEQTVVRFGYAYNAGQLPAVVGIEKGFFSQRGINVKSRIMAGGKDTVEALVVGELDIGLASAGNIIPAVAQNADIYIIASASWGGGRKRVMVRKDLDVKGFSELRGRKIAIRHGSTNYKNFLKLINALNLTIGDFKILNMKTEDSMVALQLGEIDGLFCGEPDCAVIEYTGIGYELLNFDSSEVDPGFLVVNGKFLKEHPGLIMRFLEGWLESVDFVNNYFDFSKKILGNRGDIDLEIINIAVRYVRYDADLEPFIIEAIVEDANFLFEQKQIKNLPDFDKLIVKEHLEEVKKRHGS